MSEQIVSLRSILDLGRLWASTGNLEDLKIKNQKEIKSKSPKAKRNVKFLEDVSVILVPQRVEYFTSHLSDYIWWSESDYFSFKMSAITEVKEVMGKYGEDISPKVAFTILWQSIENDTENSA